MIKKILLLFVLLGTSTFVDAQKWVLLGEGIPEALNIYQLTTIEADTSGNVYVAGQIYSPNGNGTNGVVVRWNGKSWDYIGNNFIGSGVVYTSALDSVGNLYIGGTISGLQNQGQGYTPFFMGKWDGSNWSVADGLYGSFSSIEIDHSGKLYAAGSFKDENQLNYVAEWDGENWSEFGGGGVNTMDYTEYSNNILSISIDKSNIYTAGDFRDNNGKYYVAKFDGLNWVELGTGNNALNANSYIRSVVADDFGNVYAIGDFTNSNENKYLAKWNGTTWTEVDFGTDDFYSKYEVTSLARDTSGTIYAAVNTIRYMYQYPPQVLDSAYVVKWNGTDWSVLGSEDSLYTFVEGKIPSITSDIRIEAMTIDDSGNVYVATRSLGYGYVMKWIADTTLLKSENTTSNKLTTSRYLTIYPNPSSGVVNIPNTYEHIQMNICNSLGECVAIKLLDKGVNTIDLNDLSPGVYALKFTGQEANYTTVKWIKQ